MINDDNSDAWVIEPTINPNVREFKGKCVCGAPMLWDKTQVWCVSADCEEIWDVKEGIQELKKVALKWYEHGGDSYVECFDTSNWIEWFDDYGTDARKQLIEEIGVQDLIDKDLTGLYFVRVEAEDGTHNLGSQLTLEEALAKAKEHSEYAFNQFTETNRCAVTLYGTILEVVPHD